jgi:hypothetical protein
MVTERFTWKIVVDSMERILRQATRARPDRSTEGPAA